MSLNMQPTEKMIQAGINELLDNNPGLEDEIDDEQLQDTIVFIWQAMLSAAE